MIIYHTPLVVAVDHSLDRNMIHGCTYTTVPAHNYWLTGCGGGDVIRLLIGSHAKVEDLCGYLTHSHVVGSSILGLKLVRHFSDCSDIE